tara:strand:- start:991 stop:3606 length:2616 start_codon:yes stop_codon:yes gene_type:complete
MVIGKGGEQQRSNAATRAAKRTAAKKVQDQVAKEETDLSALIDTNQQILIRNMRTAIDTSTLKSNSILTLRNPGLQGTDADLISYWGPPEDLTNKMVKPPNGQHFVHATQAQLSVLEPLLRFFIVNQDGAEREVYFSDYTSEERLLKLASLRRGNSIEESLERQAGSNVGIERFAWEYHNKHEGDKIVQASLDLYFGSLADLVNINYLQFLFTNGLKNPEAPPLGAEGENHTLQQRILALRQEIQRRKPFLQGGGAAEDASETSISEKSVKDNFRQLKVVVGWAVPKGSRSELMRLFRGGNIAGFGAGGRSQGPTNKLKSFLRGVKATQKILLLNLRTYDLDFSQNGSVKLSIQYVASTDNYMSKSSSDVLGSNNFSTGNLNDREVRVSASGLDLDKVWEQGYISYLVSTGGLKGTTKANKKIGVQLGKLREESDILQLEIKLRQMRNESNNSVGPDTHLIKLREYDKTVGALYKKAKKELLYERYQAFLARLIEQKHVYMLEAVYDSKTQETIVKPPSSVNVQDRSDIAKWLKKTVEVSKSQKKDKVKQQEDLKNVFQRSIPGAPTYLSDDDNPKQNRKIIYVRLGDLLKVGMELSSMRSDSNFIMGSWYPSQAGVPGYAPGDTDEYEMIYDIPISLEYFGQFFYKNVVLPERDEWTFREFYTALLSLVTQVLNRVTDYALRIQFGWSTFSTYSNLLPPSGIIESSFLDKVRDNLANEPYRQARPVNSYYILSSKQMSLRNRTGSQAKDESEGIYHYTIGASRGLAREFNFSAQDVPQFQAMNIEATKDQVAGLSRALILPQNVDIEMFGNTLHRNGDFIAVDSRQALGSYANSILTLGGYYRVVRSTHTITSAGYNTTLGCVFERRFSG